MLVCGVTIMKIWQLDSDTWFILNCGRYVVETGIIPHTEFATMHEGLHYVMEQWLTAVIFWKIYSNLGAEGLTNFVWFIGCILMLVYFRFCMYVSNNNEKVSALLSLSIVKIVSTAFFVTRPQIISTLILLIEVFLLEKFSREKKFWTLYLLPVMAVIFINIHAALFPMMIILMLPFIAESLYLKIQTAQNFDIPLKPLILAAIGIFLAGFINPYGWEAITFVFTSYEPTVHGIIMEMQPASVEDNLGIVLFVFSALLIIAFTKKSLPLRYFFLSFGTMILGFYALRNIFLFLILATPSLAYAAKDWHPFEKIFNWRHKLFIPLFLIIIAELCFVYNLAANSIYEFQLPTKIIFCLTIIFLICFVFFYRREGKLFSEEIFILRRKPLIILTILQAICICTNNYFRDPSFNDEPYKAAADFLLEQNRAEDITLWTGFNSGGYFEFRGIKCYLDARPEIFSLSNNHKKDIINEYLDLDNGILDYKEFFSRYNFTHIFITTADMIPYLMLSKDENYQVIFEYDSEQWGQKFRGKIFKPVIKND